MLRKISQAVFPNRQTEIVAMLRTHAASWNRDSIAQMIAVGEPPDDLVDAMATFVKEHPSLATVGDDEFIAAVQVIDPACAVLFATPGGLNLMHWMGEAVRNRIAGSLLNGLLGLA